MRAFKRFYQLDIFVNPEDPDLFKKTQIDCKKKDISDII